MKVFISGSRSISCLNYTLNNLNGNEVLIGDCYGIDLAVQTYLKSLNYPFVTVYHINSHPRNNVGNWQTHRIRATSYTAKDIAMTSDCDAGIVIWDGMSKGSLSNIHRLLTAHKPLMLCYNGVCDTITSLSEFNLIQQGLTNGKTTGIIPSYSVGRDLSDYNG